MEVHSHDAQRAMVRRMTAPGGGSVAVLGVLGDEAGDRRVAFRAAGQDLGPAVDAHPPEPGPVLSSYA